MVNRPHVISRSLRRRIHQPLRRLHVTGFDGGHVLGVTCAEAERLANRLAVLFEDADKVFVEDYVVPRAIASAATVAVEEADALHPH